MSDVKGKRLQPLMIALCMCLSTVVWADGTEILGPPSVGLADGTGFIGDGVGLLATGTGEIQFTVPPGADIVQVLLYWNGFHTMMGNSDDHLTVEGMEIAGTLIGGPTLFFTLAGNVQNWSSTYRADITAEGLVVEGPNSITVSGLDVAVRNGASIIVVIDDGTLEKDLQLRDGQDLGFCASGIPGACVRFDPPLDNPLVQTFNFAPSADDRTMDISLIGASVAGTASQGGDDRPNLLKVWVGTDPNVDPPTDIFPNPFASFSQEEWDHVCSSGCTDVPSVPTVPIPAGTDNVSIVVLSESDGTGALPASFAWLGVATSLSRSCEVEVDKQVSCDGGMTWYDEGYGDEIGLCTGWDGVAEIKVRYFARSDVDGSLYNCVLSDSNGLILPVPINVGALPGDAVDIPLHATDLIECSADFESVEPNTATLICNCFEEDSDDVATDTDQAEIDCQTVNLEIEKICEEQNPDTLDNAIHITVTNPFDPRGASLTNCVVEDPLAGFTSAPFALAPGESADFDTVVNGLVVDTLNTASVTCEIVLSGGKTVTREAEDNCEYRNCELEINKQVSCDLGVTWGESCIGWDGVAEVLVRYLANTDVTGALFNCVLTDSNGLILPTPVDLGMLPGNLANGLIWTIDPIECSADLEAGEPDTATLTCECFSDGSGFTRMDDDTANIECQVPDVDIEKVCDKQNPETQDNAIHITVSNPPNPRGASLVNCVVEDVLAGFTSDPFALAPGQSEDFDTAVNGLTEDTLNTATVVCDIVGSGGKTIDATDDDLCETPYCGDGQINQPNETCDPPGSPAGDLGNLCREDCTYCGDGNTDPGEECDPTNPNDPNLAYCTDMCTILPYCGDGIVNQPSETCDPPGSPAGGLGNLCREDCTYCGDGNTDPGEECDPTNPNDPNAPYCSNTCTILPYCGDGLVNQPNETCDPPGSPAGALGNLCREDCTYCGDGNTDPGEQCDPTNPNDPNAQYCSNTCTILPYCGDGVVNQPNETCDPPGSPAGGLGNLCRENCTYCGDGNTDPGEECDPANPNDPNVAHCSNQCTILPYCGDGEVNQPSETCDPPGSPAGAPGNLCREDCTYCGDGHTDPGEECDPNNPNDPNVAYCSDFCTVEPYCGDGEINQPDETCDPPGQPDGQPTECRENCTYCGDGNLDPNEQCDDGVNNSDAGPCSRFCMFVGECELAVQKYCVVEPPDTGDDDDDDDDDVGDDDDDDGDDDDDDDDHDPYLLRGLTLQYTGNSCAATTNTQGGKVACSGNANFSEPMSVAVTDVRGTEVYAQGVVLLGDIIDATALAAGVDQLSGTTNVSLGSGMARVTFDTSGAQNLEIGDQLGPVRVVAMSSNHGHGDDEDDDHGDDDDDDDDLPEEPTDQCVVTAPRHAPHCDSALREVTFRFLGGNCSNTSQDQEGQASCVGDAGTVDPVRLVARHAGMVFAEASSVGYGGLLVVPAGANGEDTLPQAFNLEVWDEFDNWLQTVHVMTYCLVPLDLGDRFGSLQVYGMDTTLSGYAELGGEVTYRYDITNLSASEAVNVIANDDKLGVVPGSPIPVIQPNETVTLFAAALITENTTNTVTVTGQLANGVECPPVQDSATVTVEEDVDECDGALQALLVEYTGVSLEGAVRVAVEAGNFRNDPVIYDFPNGLPTGTELTLESENNYSIDASRHGQDLLGLLTNVTINGVTEAILTDCPDDGGGDDDDDDDDDGDGDGDGHDGYKSRFAEDFQLPTTPIVAPGQAMDATGSVSSNWRIKEFRD